ncbi:hypothetical protein DIPPA_04976 [Diplonema papillatum]|nr:hypothetical protein DIPPA_04976 [Diplonema papillatum]
MQQPWGGNRDGPTKAHLGRPAAQKDKAASTTTTKLGQARLRSQGIPSPAPDEFTLAEVAGHLVHASSYDDDRFRMVSQNGKVYKTRWLSSKSKALNAVGRNTPGTELPPPQRTSFARESLPLAKVTELFDYVKEGLSQLGRHPGLGRFVYGMLHVPPSAEVAGDGGLPDAAGKRKSAADYSPPAKRRKVKPVEEEQGEQLDDEDAPWIARISGPVQNDLQVTAIAWDVYSATLALAVTGLTVGRDDANGKALSSIVLYDVASEVYTSILRTAKQQDVSCMSFSAVPGVLAVGCKDGLILWDLGTTCGAVAKGAAVAAAAATAASVADDVRAGIFSSYRSLATEVDATAKLPPWYLLPFTGDVTALCFSNISGRYLAYGSIGTPYVGIVDLSQPLSKAATTELSVVWTESYGGIRSLAFSPDDRLLAVTTPHRPVLLAFDTTTWEPIECRLPAPACCPRWHPVGHHLFFYLQGGSDVMCVQYTLPPEDAAAADPFAAQAAPPAAVAAAAAPGVPIGANGGGLPKAKGKAKLVLCEHLVPYKDANGRTVGGEGKGAVVVTLAVDPSGQRLAVALRDGLVAVYHIGISPRASETLSMRPIGLARLHGPVPGHGRLFPVKLAFSQTASTGAVLTAVWGNGLLTVLPMRFAKQKYRVDSYST